MDDWDEPVSDPVSDHSFREALFEALDGRPGPVSRRPEGLLWIASADSGLKMPTKSLRGRRFVRRRMTSEKLSSPSFRDFKRR